MSSNRGMILYTIPKNKLKKQKEKDTQQRYKITITFDQKGSIIYIKIILIGTTLLPYLVVKKRNDDIIIIIVL